MSKKFAVSEALAPLVTRGCREESILDVHKPDTSRLPETLRKDMDAAFEHQAAVMAPSTRATYKGAWRRFLVWARDRGLPGLPSTAEAVAAYASHLASIGQSYSTITIAVSAIGAAHDAAGIDPSPARSRLVGRHLKGIARTIGRYQKQKRELTDVEMRRFSAIFSDDPVGIRDRALLLLWFVCASRRSEISALQISDLDFRKDGLYVLFARSKTDQEGKGLVKAVPYSSGAAVCPVRATEAWLSCLRSRGMTQGPLFRAIRGKQWVQQGPLSPAAASGRIKRYAKLLGLDPALFSGHSLRAGFATSAARKGRSERSIMVQTGHKLFDTVLKYIRRANLMKDSAAVGLLDE